MSAFNIYRDLITEQAENDHLFLDDGKLTQFWYDPGGLNIGYGLNITANPVEARGALADVGLTFTNDQWDLILDVADDPASKTKNGAATALNNELGSFSISQLQAQLLMENYYTGVVENWTTGLPNDLRQYGFTDIEIADLQNNMPQVWAALEDLKYNANYSIYDSRPKVNVDGVLVANPYYGESHLPGLVDALEEGLVV